MRITVVSPAFPPMPGGVSDFTRRWAQALVELGPGGMQPMSYPPEITVITSPGAGDQEGVTVRATQTDWGWGGMDGLMRAIADTHPEVVIVQYVPHMYQPRGLSLPINETVTRLGRLGTPVVTLAHELYYGRHEGWKVQPYGWVQRYSLLPLFAGSAKVVLTVPDRLQRMKQVFPFWADRFTVIPVGSNLEAAPPLDRAAWRRAHDIPDGALVLMFLGLAHPSKELATLARTLDALEAAGIDACLLLAGGGTLAHPRARAMGYMAAADAQAALGAADLYVLPLADGASTRRTSLMNALAAGLPVVSTIGPNTDVSLFPPDAVRLVPARDPNAFAAATVELARDPAARVALGAAGKRLYDASFGWPVLATRWMALLETVTRR